MARMAAIAALALALAGCSQPAATPKAAPAKPPAEPSSVALFNGKDLAGWKVLTEDYFDKHGKVYVKDGAIHLDEGDAQTGIVWTRDFPKSNYEVTLEAMRVTQVTIGTYVPAALPSAATTAPAAPTVPTPGLSLQELQGYM